MNLVEGIHSGVGDLYTPYPGRNERCYLRSIPGGFDVWHKINSDEILQRSLLNQHVPWEAEGVKTFN